MRFIVHEEVSIWQNAVFAEKALFSVRPFLTHTAKQTEAGSPISVRSELLLTAHPKRLLSALAAFVPARLPEPDSEYRINKKVAAFLCGSLFNIVKTEVVYEGCCCRRQNTVRMCRNS